MLTGIAKTLAFITGQKFNFDTPKHSAASTSGNRRENAQAGGGFESLDAIYNRIAQASVQVGKRVDEQQLDAQQEGNLKLESIKQILSGQKPAFAKA